MGCFGNGCGGDSCLWILILIILIFCCCGNNNGCGCGCNNGCGCQYILCLGLHTIRFAAPTGSWHTTFHRHCASAVSTAADAFCALSSVFGIKLLTSGRFCGILPQCLKDTAFCYCGSGVEQLTRNEQVVGSIPTSSSKNRQAPRCLPIFTYALFTLHSSLNFVNRRIKYN